MLLPKLGKALFGHSNSPRARAFVRNRFRRWCPDVELPVRTRYGFEIDASPRDYASYGIYFFGDYDPRMTDMVRYHLRPGMTAWDLGAERGWFTLLMGAAVGKTGRVDAFEALPSSAERLRSAVARNGFDHVRVHNVAVSDRPGPMAFRPPAMVEVPAGGPAGNSGIGHLVSSPAEGDIVVPAIALDDLAESEGLGRLDLVKIDIEGAEPAALRGARRTLGRFRPVLAIEYNRASLRQAGSSLEDLDAQLDELGYDRLQMTSRFAPVDLEKARSRPDEHAVFNVYCFPRAGRAGAALPVAA